ncbi:MAG: ATP-binding cassette domain-containing protein [Oscillospiraceae bacterium]
MSVLECKGLTKQYGGKTVLENVDLTLEFGRIYGLIGRNGAGKTTLLSVLTAQNPATAGTVTLDGERVWENREALGRLCFARELNISAESGIASYKVKDYLRCAAWYFPNWDAEMAEELLRRFGVEEKKKLGKLSKGMLSMVTITVALASKAEFTFLDEPVAGLDVIAREEFYKLLVQEYSETGRTFVVSTHILEEAAGVLEEVIILDKGRVLRRAMTEELVGSARLVSGRAEDVDAATAGLETHRPELYGRGKSVTVLLKEGESLREGCDVTVQGMTLQKVFVALCGEEER